MKKWLIPMMLFSGLSLTAHACSPEEGPGTTENPVPAPDPAPDPDSDPAGGRCLAVYFSCTITTQGVARQIAQITGATLHRIVPAVPYTSADLDYNDPASRADREQNDPSARPAVAGASVDLAPYDVVFLGYPIWWGKAPKIILTFLESHDWAGKTIVPFCTSHASGLGSSDRDLHASAAQAVWKSGRRFRGNEPKETLERWIESLELALDDLRKGEAPTDRR